MVCRGEPQYSARIHNTFVLCQNVGFSWNMHIQVKPLGVIWGKYGDFYNRKNTIMFDDIGRNFLMNPQNGLKVGGQCLYPPFFLLTVASVWGKTNCVACVCVCVCTCALDPAFHEGPSEQGEGQGAVQTVSVPQRDRQAWRLLWTQP